jgi:hypothetical protein
LLSDFGNDVLIQGYFFQHQDRLGVRAVPIHGNIAVVSNQLVGTMFAGGMSRESSGAWVGWLNESGEGGSLLEVTYFDDDTLRFIKRYENADDGGLIDYVFRKGQGYWVGSWSGSDDRGHYGDGGAVCILTPVPPVFFTPPGT